MPYIDEYHYQKIHDRKVAESVCVAATARVMSFDPAKMTVNVQPLSKHLENGRYESQPPILRIPVAFTRSGGFIIRPWFNPGDVGVIVYLDHDMDSTVTRGAEAVPLTERNHATTDAVFIGGIVSGSYAVQGLPDGCLALAAEDGSRYVAVTEDKILIRGDVEVEGNVRVDGRITSTGGG